MFKALGEIITFIIVLTFIAFIVASVASGAVPS